MRSEAEMMRLIAQTARDDERIRAAVMTGSRTSPSARPDPFQDYDVAYLVRDVAPFWKNLEWIRRFGEIMLLQMPEDMQEPAPAADGGFAYLMLFTDGNRIDLSIRPLSDAAGVRRDSQAKVLLDKDGLIGKLPPPSDADYVPRPPTEKQFQDCCNEFWWVSTYVFKALWRGEVTQAQHDLGVVRDQLLRMLGWYAGIQTGFTASPGKQGKYLGRILEPALWDLYLGSYASAEAVRIWDAFDAAATLFRTAGTAVANHFGFAYPAADDARAMAHMRYVRGLPQTAVELYPGNPREPEPDPEG